MPEWLTIVSCPPSVSQVGTQSMLKSLFKKTYMLVRRVWQQSFLWLSRWQRFFTYLMSKVLSFKSLLEKVSNAFALRRRVRAAKGKKDTILSRQMLFKMKRVVVLFVRTLVWSYLQVLKWQKLLTFGCVYNLVNTHSHIQAKIILKVLPDSDI